MTPDDRQRADRTDLLLFAFLIAGGLTLFGISLMQLASRDQIHFAQATQPLVPSAPAESKPGGARPTTPAPEPARPDAEAQKAGAKPALPPAPAEKMGEPIRK